MISAMITGRLVKPPQSNGQGRHVGTVVCFDNDRPVRIVCRRKVHINQLLGLPLGSPVTVSGLLNVEPVLSIHGDPLVYLALEVTAVLTPPTQDGLLARLLK